MTRILQQGQAAIDMLQIYTILQTADKLQESFSNLKNPIVE